MNSVYKTFKTLFLGKIINILLLLLLAGLSSCNKYLDKKPSQNLYVPDFLNDLQALLDNNNLINQQSSPILLEIVADNYYLTAGGFDLLTQFVPEEAFNYRWDADAYHTLSWHSPYQKAIYYSNVVLDVLPDISSDQKSQNQWNSIKGSALFYRAFSFYELAQIYCKPYASSANTDPGIVLRLTSDVNIHSIRSTVQETYDRILDDLKTAVDLLPVTTTFPTRPTKAAAYGALARTYLSMRDYVNAGYYANLCLQQKSDLIDYNTSNPIQLFNAETIYFTANLVTTLSSSIARIDSTLYQSYNNSDLRKSVFFLASSNPSGSFTFIGSYAQSPTYKMFSGITTAEMYLIRGESYARAGNTIDAMTDLNKLMKKRWKNTDWIDFTATDAQDALNKILAERRKELIYRGQRWSDIRRFNLEGANITLKRIINNVTYTLPPNDPRWVMLIPQDVIEKSGIMQNLR